jgi:phospholipid-binding lipoprotein MlaA
LGVTGLVLLAVAVTGCGTMSRLSKVSSADGSMVAMPSAAAENAAPATTDFARVEPTPVVPAEPAPALVDVAPALPATVAAVKVETNATGVEADAQDASDPTIVAQARPGRAPGAKDDYDVEEYDPWEPFNEAMFEFNRKLDRYALKPVAKVYDKVVPDELQRMIDNAFDNLGSIKRMMNSLFQAKWDGAVRELSRFMLNSTVGVAGFFDMAKAAQIEKSREDFGQTLGFYGMGPGPYLVLPFQPPYTVRDFAGKLVDLVFDPLFWIPMTWWQGVAIEAGMRVNERSLNLELFQGFEETVVDLYSAVRHAYLERRRNLIKE